MRSIPGRLRSRMWTPLALAALFASDASAFQFDAPEDWSIRWDNTVKASTKYRLKKADPALSQSFIGGNPANGRRR